MLFHYICPMQNSATSFHKYVYSSEMLNLVTVSNSFCQFMEKMKGMQGRLFITEAVKHLSAIYAAFVRLDATEPVYEAAGEPTVTEQEWSEIYQRIASILRSHNDFLRPADNDEFDRSELVSHTISEDMADVYQELKDFTTIYSRGLEEFMNDAGWELQERFAEHWGKKLLRALATLHDLFVSGIDPTEEE